jgi:hypothetical protein
LTNMENPCKNPPSMKTSSEEQSPLVLFLTRHAVDRYLERVEPGLSRAEASRRLSTVVSLGRFRPTPRHWMRDVKWSPGLRFLYWAGEPNVCALIREGAVVTVLTRRLCRGDGTSSILEADLAGVA